MYVLKWQIVISVCLVAEVTKSKVSVLRMYVFFCCL